MTENRSKWIQSRQKSGGKPLEIAKNWLRRFRMEGGAKKTPNYLPITFFFQNYPVLLFLGCFGVFYHGKPQNYQGFSFPADCRTHKILGKDRENTKIITKEIYKFTKRKSQNQGKEGLGN